MGIKSAFGKITSEVRAYISPQEFEPTQQEILQDQLDDLVRDIELKQANFDNATAEFIDIAAMELDAALKRYDVVLREYKSLTGFTRGQQ